MSLLSGYVYIQLEKNQSSKVICILPDSVGINFGTKTKRTHPTAVRLDWKTGNKSAGNKKIKITWKAEKDKSSSGDLLYSDSPECFLYTAVCGTSSKETLTERSLYACTLELLAGMETMKQKQHSARLLFPHKLGVLVCNYAECWREEVQCCSMWGRGLTQTGRLLMFLKFCVCVCSVIP